jgi:NADPH:quinone reductase
MQAIVASLVDPSTRTTKVVLDSAYPLPKPTEGQLLVRVLATTIDASDVLNVKGDFPMTTFPRIPGRNFAGIVTEPQDHPLYNKHVYGTSGSQFSFTRDGAHAQYLAVPEQGVAEVPANVDLVAATAMGTPWTTAYLSLQRARPQPGETVLILGAAGAVGQAAVQLAKSSLFQCKVLTAGRGGKYDVDSSQDATLSAAKELTGGRGVDIVIDTTGDSKLVEAALGQLGRGGRITSSLSAPEEKRRSN